MSDWYYSIEYFIIQIEREEYSTQYYQSQKNIFINMNNVMKIP